MCGFRCLGLSVQSQEACAEPAAVEPLGVFPLAPGAPSGCVPGVPEPAGQVTVLQETSAASCCLLQGEQAALGQQGLPSVAVLLVGASSMFT